MTNTSDINIALAGTPNSGKTSIFNRLTGLKQHIGNYPGVTVDKKEGYFSLNTNKNAKLLDLPGTHSLYPVSDDERVVLNILLNPKSQIFPDVVLYIANAAHLERSLLLLTQISDIGIPVICCLNMIDVATNEGIVINSKQLEQKIEIPVIEVNGRTGSGIKEIKDALLKQVPKRQQFTNPTDNEEITTKINTIVTLGTPYIGLLYACHYQHLSHLSNDQKYAIHELVVKNNFSAIRAEVNDKTERISLIESITESSKTIIPKKTYSRTSKIDNIITHKFWGTLLFLVVLFLLFQAIFFLADIPMHWIDHGITGINNYLRSVLPISWWSSFLTEGLITGIGGILIFLPQIAILFGLITILEESGYMTRAVYLSDNLMKKVGLNGRSLVSLISGVACAVPAIMSTRTIGNHHERLATIFVTPFISCSARLPVYIVLTAMVIPKTTYFGFINAQGLVMMGLYLLGAITAITTAWMINVLFSVRQKSYLMLELPPYQWPQVKNIGINIYEKCKVFILKVGKIIIIISVILWALASFGPGNHEEKSLKQAQNSPGYSSLTKVEQNNLISSKKLENSYAGALGHFIEPAIRPLGFDWKIGIALISSFAAREVFVSTMATLYAAGRSGDNNTIIQRLRNAKIAGTDEPVYTSARALSLLVFYVFAMQCISTLATVRRETKSWKIPLYQFFYMTGLAYLASFITFHVFS